MRTEIQPLKHMVPVGSICKTQFAIDQMEYVLNAQIKS